MQKSIKYIVKIIGTEPTTFVPIRYKLNVFTAVHTCSNWSGRSPDTSDKTDIPLKNDGINNIIKGIVTAKAFERAFADASMDRNRINNVPIYPPKTVNR